MKDKVITARQAVELVRDGDTVAFGGNVMHRSPMRMALLLAEARKKHLHIVKTAMAYEADLLCAADCVDVVSAGFVGYETEFGLCGHYRTAVESGRVRANEMACYTVITSLRAAAYGVPFLPVRGMQTSDLMSATGLRKVTDPYTGEEIVAIRRIRPDVAFIHVSRADREGNGRILGPAYEDELMSKAARTVVLTCEELCDAEEFRVVPAQISAAVVDHVVLLPKGALPGSCWGFYDMDRDAVKALKAAKEENIMEYVANAVQEAGL